ncbi:TetR family transcriptional regulator [Peribacillus simplex]|nr:TetR family transcriptional regulator [Peribacillus simplex]
MVERTTEGRERAKRQGKHMGRPGQDEKTLKRAIKLYNERETNGMSVKDIVKTTGVPRSTLYTVFKLNPGLHLVAFLLNEPKGQDS